ncbi:hypothetical protein [Hafnia alvei]|uniref:hypothetical protein n=1 Tax=Hafnia alvei TaxID=569 RepID=UPI000E00E2B8|nr:hypothetical protein [Hafnia alvei]STQ71484.1 Uncharacterised protein [Hafnia alvei]STQ74384.1 Uncharacterised protein [Hafnia alvei]
MTSREQFEAWAPNYCWKYSTTKELAWLAWQASREAVEVQLPDHRDYEETLSDHELGFNTGLEQCAEAIRAAGIKVKGE